MTRVLRIRVTIFIEDGDFIVWMDDREAGDFLGARRVTRLEHVRLSQAVV